MRINQKLRRRDSNPLPNCRDNSHPLVTYRLFWTITKNAHIPVKCLIYYAFDYPLALLPFYPQFPFMSNLLWWKLFSKNKFPRAPPSGPAFIGIIMIMKSRFRIKRYSYIKTVNFSWVQNVKETGLHKISPLWISSQEISSISKAKSIENYYLNADEQKL